MIRGKGLKRLAFFIVFLIPVAWYLFLQLFGSNRFALEVKEVIPDSCQQFRKISVIYKTDSIRESQSHYMNRIRYTTDEKKVPLILDKNEFFACIQNGNDLILVSEEGVWGSYNLDREGVDLLLTELDVLLIQKSYGKGVSR